MKSIKTLVGISLAATLLIPAFSFTASTSDLYGQIQALLNQIAALQAQIKSQGDQPTAFCHTFGSNLRYADSGTEVTALQGVLTKEGFTIASQESEIAGGAAQFGDTTAAAVTGFQQKYASEILGPAGLKYGTGFVGAGTRAKLNSIYGCNGGTTPPVLPPAINVPKITRISGLASEDNELSPGGRFAISGSNLIGAGDDTAKVYITDIGNKLATITQSSNELIWAVAPAVLEKSVVLVQVVNSNGSSNIVRATVLGTPATASSITITSPAGNSSFKVRSVIPINWSINYANSTGIGFDKVQLVVGNSLVNRELQLYDRVSQVDFIPVPQISFQWNIPDLLSDFAKGSGYNNDQIGNYFYLAAKGIKNDSNGGGIVATSAKVPFIISSGSTTSVPPSVYSVYPTSGPMGTTVYINGSGFTPTNNTVNFGYGVITGLPATTWISDNFTTGTTGTGMTIAFQVPSSMSPACANTTPRCMIADMLTTPGDYKVWVTNANGTSASAPIFTVTGNTTVLPANPSITVLWPTGGTWTRDSQQTFTWTTKDVAYSSVFSVNVVKGADDYSVASNIPMIATDKQYVNWQVGKIGSATIPDGAYIARICWRNGEVGGCNLSPVFNIVSPTPPPTTFSSFTAAPATIASGQMTTISFYGTNLSTVKFNVSCPSGVSSPDGPGGDFCGQTPTFASGVNSTQLQFNNSAANNQQATITGSAYDANGLLVGTKSAYVTVTGAQTTPPPSAAPTLNLSAYPTSISANQSASISWQSTSASSCSISTGGGIPASGYLTVNPTQTTTYVVTCYGSGGSTAKSVTVTVGGVSTTPPTTPPTTYTPPATSMNTQGVQLQLANMAAVLQGMLNLLKGR